MALPPMALQLQARKESKPLSNYRRNCAAHETSKKDRETGPHGRAPQRAARQSDLQLDCAPTNQNHARESESGATARRTDGHTRQERFAACAANGILDLAAE